MPSVLIMAGGKGERFWPASTQKCPKQYLPLTGSLPMIQETVIRVTELVGINNIFVVTTKDQLLLAESTLPTLPRENIITEPEGRNTGPCLAISISNIKQRLGSDEIIAVLPADHFIKDPKKFRNGLEMAFSLAASKDEIITFGIKPDRAETGYGYIAVEDREEVNVYQGLRFVEKPDSVTAMKYVTSGKYLWNSGMFVFKIQTFINKLRQCAVELYSGFLELENCTNELEVAEVYRRLPRTSIDYGLMEKLPSFLVIQGDYGWDDLGTWRALESTNIKDHNGNVFTGNAETIDVSDSIIYSTGKLVAAIGVQNLVIVDCEEATLVCHKDRVQDVKKLVEKLKT